VHACKHMVPQHHRQLQQPCPHPIGSVPLNAFSCLLHFPWCWGLKFNRTGGSIGNGTLRFQFKPRVFVQSGSSSVNLQACNAAIGPWNSILAGTGGDTYSKEEVDQKFADKAVVQALQGVVEKKADAADVTTKLSKKADKTYVDTVLADKADMTVVQALQGVVEDKADAADVTTKLGKKADTTYVDTVLADKANQTLVESLQAQVKTLNTVVDKYEAKFVAIDAEMVRIEGVRRAQRAQKGKPTGQQEVVTTTIKVDTAIAMCQEDPPECAASMSASACGTMFGPVNVTEFCPRLCNTACNDASDKDSTNHEQSAAMSGGSIAAIVVATLVVLIGVCVGIFCCMRKQEQGRQRAFTRPKVKRNGAAPNADAADPDGAEHPDLGTVAAVATHIAGTDRGLSNPMYQPVDVLQQTSSTVVRMANPTYQSAVANTFA